MKIAGCRKSEVKLEIIFQIIVKCPKNESLLIDQLIKLDVPRSKMINIYPTSFYTGGLDTSSDFIKSCVSNENEKVENFLKENVNIYERALYCYSFTALHIALANKNEKIACLLLDIYERDLAALEGTRFKRALVATPADQTEEFWQTIETENTGDVSPVFVKVNNSDTPRCVYLRKSMRDRSDLSLKIANDLEHKNGLCDLNWRLFHGRKEDSYLHLAIYHEMKTIVKRLLSHRTVEKKILNERNHSPLHYAIFVGNLIAAKGLLTTSEYESCFEDFSYLYQAAVSGKHSAIDFLITNLIENGLSWEEIKKISFPYEDYNEEMQTDLLIHVLAKKGNFLYFFNNPKHAFKDDDFYVQNSKGETILHLLVAESFHKTKVKVGLIQQIVKMYPKLLLIENKDHQLPLHYSAFHDVLGQKLFQTMLKLTVNESGNSEIFCSNSEAAIATFEKAIKLNKGLSEEYVNSFEDLITRHGSRLLQKTITVDKRLKSLIGILSSRIKINPNEFYDGTNAFILMIASDIDRTLYWRPGQETFKRFKMLVDYHQIEDFNARDQSGTTLFMFLVAFCEDNTFIKQCIESGADCSANNDDNLNCLHFAATNPKNKEIIAILLEHDANPKAVSNSNQLPIHYAIKNENFEAIEDLSCFLEHEDFMTKYGSNEETLIQFSAYALNEKIFKIVWDLYDLKKIKIDVNETNLNGENLPMIALRAFNHQHLGLIMSNCINDLKFETRSSTYDTFTHKFAMCQQMVRCSDLFEDFPVLTNVINDQMNVSNNDGDTPMDLLAAICPHLESDDEAFVLFLIKHISLQNLKKNLHKLIKCFVLIQKLVEHYPDLLEDNETFKIFEESLYSREVFLYFLKNIKNVDKIRSLDKNRNILHLVCDLNDSNLIDSVLKSLTEDAWNILVAETDADSRKPYDLLDDTNKILLKNCF